MYVPILDKYTPEGIKIPMERITKFNVLHHQRF